jgi:Ala-tRNA(Pro) deacylase
MSISARLKECMDREHSHYTVINHPLAYTAQGVASALHLDGKEVAKAVVVHASGEQEEAILAVLPTSRHVDLKKLARTVGKPLRLATEHEFASLFPDCELGAMSPFGQLYGLPVYVDETLAEDKEIVFNAGTHSEAIRMPFEEFRKLVQPVICSFARKGSHEEF